MSRFHPYTGLFPLVVTELPDRVELGDLEAYRAEIDAIYERNERFATLVDTSRLVRVPSAVERRFLSDWQNATVELIRRYSVYNATVVRAPLMRAAMTSINWVFPPPNDQSVVGTFEQAFELCVDRLRSEPRPLPRHLAAVANARPSTLGELLRTPS